MKNITSAGLLAYVRQYAIDDSGGTHTGWCSMGNLSCAYYPDSKRHSYFLAGLGVINTRDAGEWLFTKLGTPEHEKATT